MSVITEKQQQLQGRAYSRTEVENSHIGSSFDDFLEEEGLLSECTATAIKRVIAWQIKQEMEQRGLSQTAMAKSMHTSRSSLNRLLDPENTSVTLSTLDRAAAILGKKLKIDFVDPT